MANEEKLRKVLRRVFDGCQTFASPGKHRSRRKEFVFHMTDWVGDLERLTRLYKKPLDQQAAEEIIVAFLSHAVPHLNAAGRLLLDNVPDTFAKRPRGNDRNVSVGGWTTRSPQRKRTKPRLAMTMK